MMTDIMINKQELHEVMEEWLEETGFGEDMSDVDAEDCVDLLWTKLCQRHGAVKET